MVSAYWVRIQGRIQDLAMGGKISSEASYIYERSEYKSDGGWGALFFKFTTLSESERNLTKSLSDIWR